MSRLKRLAALFVVLAACGKKEEPPKDPAAVPATFFAATRKGNLPLVQAGLKADPELARAKDSSGQWTALHLAGTPEVAAALLEAGANLEARGAESMTPLHSAVSDERGEVAKLLLKKKASLQARMHDPPYTPLQLAVVRHRAELTAYLLALSSPQDIAETLAGEPPLHLAVRTGDATIAELLLIKGADPNAADQAGRTALFLTTSTEMADLLLSKGALATPRTADGQTLIASLLRSTAPAAAEHLLERRVALDADNIGKSLLAAVEGRAVKIVRLLLERRPDYEHKRVAILRSAWLGQPEIVDLLASEGAAQAQDPHGRNALHHATTADVIGALHRHGVYLDARDQRGQTPLHAQIAAGRERVAFELVGQGAEVGPVSNDGDTPLHLACALNFAGLAGQLIERGAEVNVRNKLGITPLHYAAYSGDLELAKLLLQKGADPLAKINARVTIGAGRGDEPANPMAGQDVAGKSPFDLTPFPAMKTLLKAYFPKDD